MDPYLEDRALRFATAAHSSIRQKRKYDHSPYIFHPVRVAELVAQTGASREAVAASYLHDTVEDVPLANLIEAAQTVDSYDFHSLDMDSRRNRLLVIRTVFDARTSALVEMVTDVSKPSDGNRKTRKAIDLEHMSRADAEGQTIRLADILDNGPSIIDNDPEFAKVWVREKREMLPVLMDGDAGLLNRVHAMINDYYGVAAFPLARERGVFQGVVFVAKLATPEGFEPPT